MSPAGRQAAARPGRMASGVYKRRWASHAIAAMILCAHPSEELRRYQLAAQAEEDPKKKVIRLYAVIECMQKENFKPSMIEAVRQQIVEINKTIIRRERGDCTARDDVEDEAPAAGQSEEDRQQLDELLQLVDGCL
eukprot:768373-Hanusia_phi.AAC.19